MVLLSEEPLSSGFLDLADWIEVHAGELDLSTVTETSVAQALDHSGTHVAQDTIAGAIAVLRRRSAALADSYPFVANRRRLAHRPGDHSLLYTALTALSTVNHARLEAQDLSALATAFEEIASEILQSTWGSAGRAVHFGWPTRAGRPKSFPLAVTWLAQRLALSEGAGYRPPERQDGGVDLVAWNQLADGSTADVRLGQCTISRDIERKARDIDTSLWETWIEFPHTPTVALLVPYQVPQRTPISDGLRRRGFLVLDRVRIIQQAAQTNLSSRPLADLVDLLDLGTPS